MLELRPNCECCDEDLKPDQPGAWICSFECTFCTACANQRLHGSCPNCGGELLPRPLRSGAALARPHKSGYASPQAVQKAESQAKKIPAALYAGRDFSARFGSGLFKFKVAGNGLTIGHIGAEVAFDPDQGVFSDGQ
ncbi:MAG: DUF1272 domain-containing protein [Ketobacter sp. GenoA1]|nr:MULTISPECIES: DUF1272 domain-containing protein [unclassified Ketobacter]RLT90640.1 MAG: DUF1272 domain-containing protein [Ketobacter sp. GenoA1]RLT99738.1 MAG: DUF1272 domain-containing protein [Ketobacter sp.]